MAYVFAMCCDWFLVSGLAKGFAFRFLVKPEDTPFKKVICISCCMVVPMVIIMSLYGACEGAVHTGAWSDVPMRWLMNIPRNFVMALPLQLLIAGPLVRKVFRTAFPMGDRTGSSCIIFGFNTFFTFKRVPKQKPAR